jgi:hypothetical protein
MLSLLCSHHWTLLFKFMPYSSYYTISAIQNPIQLTTTLLLQAHCYINNTGVQPNTVSLLHHYYIYTVSLLHHYSIITTLCWYHYYNATAFPLPHVTSVLLPYCRSNTAIQTIIPSKIQFYSKLVAIFSIITTCMQYHYSIITPSLLLCVRHYFISTALSLLHVASALLPYYYIITTIHYPDFLLLCMTSPSVQVTVSKYPLHSLISELLSSQVEGIVSAPRLSQSIHEKLLASFFLPARLSLSTTYECYIITSSWLVHHYFIIATSLHHHDYFVLVIYVIITVFPSLQPFIQVYALFKLLHHFYNPKSNTAYYHTITTSSLLHQ